MRRRRAARASGAEPPAPALPVAARQIIVDAVRPLGRGIGKVNLARALRGSRARR